jgi:HAD superfamily hydrolase (TIGR01490 family)
MRYAASVTHRAALFDMDRTLLATNSALLYTRYRRERGEISLGAMLRVVFWLTQYRLGVIDAEKIAAQVVREYSGREEAALRSETELWFRERVLSHVRAKARAVVEHHRRLGHHLAIVTAATPYAAAPLASELGIEHLVASELEIEGSGKLTGRFAPPLCYGAGKVARTERLAAELGFRLEDAVFYSDSITDLPLFERVGAPVAVCPDRRLYHLARRRGWRIEDWSD